jgi:hypothetical protein
MKNYKKLKQLKQELFKRLTGVKPDTFKAMLQECELSHERKKSKNRRSILVKIQKINSQTHLKIESEFLKR